MRPFLHTAFLLFALFTGFLAFAPYKAHGAPFDDFGAVGQVRELSVSAEVAPPELVAGEAFKINLHVVIPPAAHGFPNAEQKGSQSSALSLDAPAGITLDAPVWPKAIKEKNVVDEYDFIYHGEVVIAISGKANQAGTYAIKGVFNGPFCDDKGSCYMPKDYAWEVKVVVKEKGSVITPLAPTPPTPPKEPELSTQTTLMPVFSFDIPWLRDPVDVDPNHFSGLALILAFSALGGFILNFMPCVLPVIPIKILGLAQSAGSRGRRLFLGGVMSAGVIALWLVMGAILAFTSVLGGTSELFLSPWVNLVLGSFIVLMAIATTGLFAIRLPQFIYKVNPKHNSALGSFGFGMMTGVFALPCIGPFMGTAAATVLKTHNAPFILAVFASIGVGMALPYFVLAANPKWVDKLPRSGPASDVMKSFLGWMMLAGGAYFIQAAITQWLDSDAHFGKRGGVIVVMILLGLAGLFLVKGCLSLWKKSAHKIVVSFFLIMGLSIASFGAWQTYEEVATRPFPFLRFEEEAKLPFNQGKIVVVDFRSNVCPNCDWNEKNVFNTPQGRTLLGSLDVMAYQARIERKSDLALIQKLSSNAAVPYMVFYSPSGTLVKTLDGTVTLEQLQGAIEKARSSK